MNKYSQASEEKLSECDSDLVIIFRNVLPIFNHSIICGHRDKSEQDILYPTHTKVQWPNSKHNREPAEAVDAAPWPINWRDKQRFYYFGGVVMGVAAQLYDEGLISRRLRWGGDWDMDTEVRDNTFNDLIHFELI